MIKNVAKKIWRHESGNQTKYMELSTHSHAQVRKYLVVLSGIVILLVSVYPFLTGSTYQGSADFHESIEMVGVLLGLVTGFALITHFYSLGNRLHLLIGLAFFVNGAQDFVRGFLSFGSTRWFGGPESSLALFIPGAGVTGRILLGLILITALFTPMGSTESRNLKKETILASLTVIFLSISATVLTFKIPLPDFIYPDRLISRPVDFLSALILLVALYGFLRLYHQKRAMLIWWISLSISVHMVGQVLMSFSKTLYDPFFDIAHVYKVFGYLIPLFGFSLYQIAVILERKQAEQKLSEYSDGLEVLVEERTAETRKINEQLQDYITERKQAEEALLRTEREKTAILNGIKEHVVLIDKNMKIQWANDEACKSVGFSPEESIEQYCYTFWRNRRDPCENCPAMITFETGEPQEEEMTFAADGKTLILRSYPVLDQNGVVSEVVEITQDITERKQAEEALQQSENKYRTLLENLPQKIFLKDRNLVYISCNENYARDLKIKPGEIAGKTDYDFYPKELAEKYRADDEKIMESRNTEDIEERYIQNGQEGWVHTVKTPVKDERGDIIAILGVFWDITGRKKAEEVQALLAAALSQAAETIMIADPDGTIQFVNPAFEHNTGYASREVIGKKPGILKSGHHDDAFYEELWDTISRGEVWTGHFINKKKDGSIFHEDATISPVIGEKGKIINYVALKRDVTHQIDLETQLRQAQKLEGIGQLAAGIAHEINTPTQYVGDNTRFLQESFENIVQLLEKYGLLLSSAKENKPNSDLLAEIETAVEQADLEYLMEEIPQAIEQSLEGIERVSKIVHAMKEFSHPGAEEKKVCDLNSAIENTITVARNEWKYVADMKTDLDPKLTSVPCLLSEFNQAILNIIINAAQAIVDVVGDGAEKKGTITITTREKGDWAEIRLTDTGIGIPEKARERIFEPFFTTKEVGKGTGQGLAIAYNVVVGKHGGTIDFETETGKGTTFIIRLPLNPEPDN